MYRRRLIWKCDFKMLHSTSAWVIYCIFAVDLQNTFLEKHLQGIASLFCISFALVQVIRNKFSWPAYIIYRLEFVDWLKFFWKFSLFFTFFEIISQLLAVIEAPIMFLFQSLVKQMFTVIAEAVPHSCSSKKIIWSTPVINVKRNNFTNNVWANAKDIFLLYTS